MKWKASVPQRMNPQAQRRVPNPSPGAHLEGISDSFIASACGIGPKETKMQPASQTQLASSNDNAALDRLIWWTSFWKGRTNNQRKKDEQNSEGVDLDLNSAKSIIPQDSGVYFSLFFAICPSMSVMAVRIVDIPVLNGNAPPLFPVVGFTHSQNAR